MNLYAKLKERQDKPLRVGLIGAGKFAAMYIGFSSAELDQNQISDYLTRGWMAAPQLVR